MTELTEKELSDIESNNEKAAEYVNAPGLVHIIDQDGPRSVSGEREVRIVVQDVPLTLPVSGVDADGFPCSTAEDVLWFLKETKNGTDIPTQKFCRVTYCEHGRPVARTSMLGTWIREPAGEQLEKFQKWLAGAIQIVAPYLLGETKYAEEGSDGIE